MQINWKVRAKNPVFWVTAIVGVVLSLINGVGMTWDQMTSFPMLGETLLRAIANPVVLVAAVWGFVSAAIDPTTAGVGDSYQAQTYTEPKRDSYDDQKEWSE